MRYVTLNTNDVTIYPRDIDGRKFNDIYGQELAPIIYDYAKTSDLTVFDKNKELIKQKYKENSKSSKPFFDRLKKIIYLTDVYLQRQTFNTVWDIPLIVRKMSRGALYLTIGYDQLHILKYCKVREFEFIELSNIEFSEDFEPKLKTMFPEGTNFNFEYDTDKKQYSFTPIYKKIHTSPNFNLERFLNSKYIKDHPSAILVQPNRVSLRDAAILSIRKKG